jgi:hypothetical protein
MGEFSENRGKMHNYMGKQNPGSFSACQGGEKRIELTLGIGRI